MLFGVASLDLRLGWYIEVWDALYLRLTAGQPEETKRVKMASAVDGHLPVVQYPFRPTPSSSVLGFLSFR